MEAAMQQAVIEQTVLQVAHQLEDKLDGELQQMDNMGEEDIEQLRQSRLTQLKKQKEKREQWIQKGHGQYQHLLDEKEFFAAMKGEERMLCHFFRDNMPCKVIDRHLDILSKQHMECKFTKIDAEKSPFLTEKLKIWMLPTIALVKNQKVVEYVVGLDDMGGREDFPTEALAAVLSKQGILFDNNVPKAAGAQRSVRKGQYMVANKGEDDEDSDFD